MGIRNLVLVHPKHNRFVANVSTFDYYGLGTPHTGLPILAALLEQRGYSVRVFADRVRRPRDDEIAGADVLGISMQTIDAPAAYALARRWRDRGKIVVLGGVHATLNPDEALDHADLVIRQEGEVSFLRLLDVLDRGGDLRDVRGLSYIEGGRKHHNPPEAFIENLDALPLPDLTRVEGLGQNLRTLGNRFFHFTQLTRGCPRGCIFCSITPCFGLPHRQRSLDSLVDEIRRYKRAHHGRAPYIFFYDDNFMGDLDYARQLLAGLIAKDCVPAGWHSQMRLEAALDEELVDLMARTHCIIGTFGFESINPKTLAYLHKGQDVSQIVEAIERLHRHRIMINGFFVLGSEHDSLKTVEQTVSFAERHQLDLAAFMPLTPFPGTELFRRMQAEDRIFTQNWELYDVQHVVYRPSRMSPLELHRALLDTYRRFYWRRRPSVRRPVEGTSVVWSLLPWVWGPRVIHAVNKMDRLDGDYYRLLEQETARPWRRSFTSPSFATG